MERYCNAPSVIILAALTWRLLGVHHRGHSAFVVDGVAIFMARRLSSWSSSSLRHLRWASSSWLSRHLHFCWHSMAVSGIIVVVGIVGWSMRFRHCWHCVAIHIGVIRVFVAHWRCCEFVVTVRREILWHVNVPVRYGHMSRTEKINKSCFVC
jgi:hypothetical protein